MAGREKIREEETRTADVHNRKRITYEDTKVDNNEKHTHLAGIF